MSTDFQCKGKNTLFCDIRHFYYMAVKTDVDIHCLNEVCGVFCTKLFNLFKWRDNILLLNKEWLPISTQRLSEISLTFFQESGCPRWGLRDGVMMQRVHERASKVQVVSSELGTDDTSVFA